MKTNDNLPKTWGEFCKNNPIKHGESYISSMAHQVISFVGDNQFRRESDIDILPNKETATAFLALMQLIQLRDCYRQGWVPDWEDDLTEKYIITNEWGEPTKEYYAKSVCHILSFQTEELRDQFFENFKDLIEQAVELI